jgi:tripartite-type tricarboxylate transporter receptor subunit TctC
MKKLLTLIIGAIMASAVFAQTYRLYVPFPAGGPADTLARTIAKEMEKQGAEILVVNKAGADGLIAINEMLSKKQDFNQFLLTTIGTTVTATANNPEYAEKFQNLVPVNPVCQFYSVVLVHSKTGIKTFPQLTSAIGSAPTNIASTGGQQLLMSKSVFGNLSNSNFVTYPGEGPLTQQFLGGHFNVSVQTYTRVIADHITAGTLTPLATTYGSTINGIPPLSQFGISALYGPYYMMYGLKESAPEVVSKFVQQLSSALDSADMQAYLQQQHFMPVAKKDTKSVMDLQQSLLPKVQRALQTK